MKVRKKIKRADSANLLKSDENGASLCAMIFVVIAMVFGGGPGAFGVSFLLLAISGLALLLFAVRGNGIAAFQSLPIIVRLALALPVALPLLQLVPLPPALWQSLPGQELRLAVLQNFDLAGTWQPLSIIPSETAYSAVLAIAMLGLMFALLAMHEKIVNRLVQVMVAVIGVAVLIGLVQFSSGGSVLQFHAVAHRDALIGFFANKNHMGLTLACLVPLSYLLIEKKLDGGRGALVLLGVGWVTLIALLVATNSRAGLLLGLAAMLFTSLRIFPRQSVKVVGGAALFSALVVVLASTVPAISAIFDRFGSTGQDVRINFLDQGMPLIGRYWVLGSGLGSFEYIYSPTEKLAWVSPVYLNHLHNDWLQIIIEGGLPGALTVVAMGVALLLSFGQHWNARSATAPAKQGRNFIKETRVWAGFLMIALFAAHSLVDYPIRRAGTLVLLIVALSFVFRPLVRGGGQLRPA